MNCCVGHIYAPFELKDGGQFHSGQILHDIEDGVFVNVAICEVGVALFAGQHNQAKWFDLFPKALVVHRLKPIHNVVYIAEFHNQIISERRPHSQFVCCNQGNP